VDTTRRRPRATLATAVAAVTLLVVTGAGGADDPSPASVDAATDVRADRSPLRSVAGGAAADGPTSPATATDGSEQIAVALPAEVWWRLRALQDDPDHAVWDESEGELSPTGAAGASATRALAAGAATEPPDVGTTLAPEGHAIVTGTAEAGAGPTVRFTVELELATGIAPAAALEVAEAALLDPRSWARDRHLVRIEDPEHADIRLLFATPSTVDRLCGEVGLRTHGVYSCWTGTFATINSWRYAFGATGFDDLDTYRRYVVNHEVGHGLGFGHVGCPGPGELAPVMMQQSASLGACVANGWPHPD
jgi:hypothetical protein